MGRSASTIQSILRKTVKSHKGMLSSDEKNKLWWNVCDKNINFTDKDHITNSVSSHFKSGKHKEKLNNWDKSHQQQHITTSLQNAIASEQKNQYFSDLTKAFLSADIPLHKLKNENLVLFLKKYTKENQPNPSTLRNHYVREVYNNTIEKVLEIIGDNDIYIILDDTQDSCERYAVNILVGSLGGNYCKPMLIKTQHVEVPNHTAFLQVINNAMNIIFKNDIKYGKLKLIVTDQARVMLKTVEVLKQFYPYVMHITCLVHALNRVCEKVREEIVLVNKFISLMKKVLRKSPRRQQLFKNATNLPLPRNPIIIRWNSWLNTAS